jgi:hypothetical protein
MILSNNIAYHALQFQKGPRFESSMWKKIIFFLDIKKFLYTHEKYECNDINKHIFEKCIDRKKKTNL